ncbi:MAG: hypothetical protein M1836_004851 [Candelina mexicana]|nr:MAG: hypothetical protein M1836_004851 [Candelina mexicana]
MSEAAQRRVDNSEDRSEEGSSGLPECGDSIDPATFEQILEMDDDEEDREFSRSIVYGFFEQAEGTFKKMESNIAKGDLASLSSLGHFLKGSSATLGLTKVKDSCEKIQHYGAHKDAGGTIDEPDDTTCLNRIKHTLADVRIEYMEVEKVLKRFYNDKASKPQLQASLRKFSSEVLDAAGDDTAVVIPEKAIRPVGTLHLTLGVMSLMSAERVDRASELLEQVDLLQMLRKADMQTSQPDAKSDPAGHASQDEAAGSDLVSPLMVTLSSLNSMHAPKRTSILYANPTDTSNRVQPFCMSLRETFEQAGFLLADDRPLLLHATIMNTIYATDRRSCGPTRRGKGLDNRGASEITDGERGHGMKKKKLTIDAAELIQKYKGYEWAKDFRIEKVAICKMGAKRSIDQDGNAVEEYEEVTGRALP